MTPARLILLSAGVRRIPRLQTFLDDYRVVESPPARFGSQDRVLAWGRRPSALRAIDYARRHGLGVLHVEDGFLRSVGLGASDPPLSIVADEQTLYLDSSRPSRLEALVAQPLTQARKERARALMAAWRQGRVSKYNHSRDADIDARDSVLVVDQTLGDASITEGGAQAAAFERMLQCALDENPDRPVLLKVHPDVLSGRKRGHYDLQRLRGHARIRILDDVHPACLLAQVCTVYAVTSQMGFEALLWGVPVRLFGMPFYGGWGLTQDEVPGPPRRRPILLEQLVHAALVDYSRYVDPETGQRCEPEVVIDWLSLQRRMRQRFEPHVYAVGFSSWKRRYVREFFGGSHVHFVRTGRGHGSGHTTAVWGSGVVARSSGGRLVRVEDGFLRSVGLGAELIRPISWVQDDLGIYYDATRPSRLEHILKNEDFPAGLVARAAALRQAICKADVTKYNLAGTDLWKRPPSARQIILVPGQVETDASIRHGANGIAGNMALLQEVRSLQPSAHILYKPHPDVAAGLRAAGQDERNARRWCDEVIGNVSMGALLQAVDEVHTLTSLTGFEALMRGVAVTTYGQPFYAGWGQTNDLRLTAEVRGRRGRSLSLDEFVAGVLMLYPTYVSRITRRYTTAERALQELIEWRQSSTRTPAWQRWIARIFRQA